MNDKGLKELKKKMFTRKQLETMKKNLNNMVTKKIEPSVILANGCIVEPQFTTEKDLNYISESSRKKDRLIITKKFENSFSYRASCG